MFKGGKEFNNLLKSSKTPGLVDINFAKHAASMGAKSEEVSSLSDLEEAFKRAKKSDITYVISIKTHAYKWMEGSAFWDSPTLEIPTTKENKDTVIALNAAGADVSFAEIKTDKGHDSFLVNEPEFLKTLKGFIDSMHIKFKNEKRI